MKTIEAYCNEKLALMGKATKGPWVRERSGSGVEIYDPNEPDDSDYKVCPIGSFGLKDDTDAAVDSRNHRESELAALRVAVKALAMACRQREADLRKQCREALHADAFVDMDVPLNEMIAALREVAALLGLDKETNDAS